jgi:hypothetical protein
MQPQQALVPTRQATAAATREYVTEHRGNKPITLTRKNKAAVDAMVWLGMNRADAAKHAGMQDQSLYVALSKPHVRSYYLAQCEVLRTSGRARRIHRLEAMVEQDENKQAVVNACKALDQQDDSPQAAAARSAAPGFVVVVVQANSGPAIATLPNQGNADD